jgi:hypothetical protein
MNHPLEFYAPFTGDARNKRVPTLLLPNVTAISITNGGARDILDFFHLQKSWVATAQASTLWVLLVWCQTHNFPYRLSARPGEGYLLEAV